MAKNFRYFDDWRTEMLTCHCGWQGRVDPSRVEAYAELFDFSCPDCDRMLAIVSYATIEETRENLDKLTEEERARFHRVERAHEDFRQRALKSPDQLPDLEGAILRLTWGFEKQGEEDLTVIRSGRVVVWSEPAVWEGAGRFQEVASILKQRYGDRLKDLAPTDESYLFLLGDNLSAADRVEAIRRQISTG